MRENEAGVIEIHYRGRPLAWTELAAPARQGDAHPAARSRRPSAPAECGSSLATRHDDRGARAGVVSGGASMKRPMDADRDRGTPRDATPPTPPGIRVRTTAVRPVERSRQLEIRQAE